LVAAAAMGAAVARRKGWHSRGFLAAGGINKERFKKGGILKVCRSFFLFFLHTAQQHTATLRPWHRDFLFCSFLALLFFLHRLYLFFLPADGNRDYRAEAANQPGSYYAKHFVVTG
jgi:hypothetical protein